MYRPCHRPSLHRQQMGFCVVDMPGYGARRAFPARNRAVALIEGDAGREDTATRAVATALARFGGSMRWCRTPAS